MDFFILPKIILEKNGEGMSGKDETFWMQRRK